MHSDFFVSAQTIYEHKCRDLYEGKSHYLKNRYDSSRHCTARRNQRKVWNSDVHFQSEYMYLERPRVNRMPPALVRKSEQRTPERESTITYRSSRRRPRATLTFTAAWTQLCLQQQGPPGGADGPGYDEGKCVGRKEGTVCHRVPGWPGPLPSPSKTPTLGWGRSGLDARHHAWPLLQISRRRSQPRANSLTAPSTRF